MSKLEGGTGYICPKCGREVSPEAEACDCVLLDRAIVLLKQAESEVKGISRYLDKQFHTMTWYLQQLKKG